MLKQYALEDLKEGMVLGRPIYEDDAAILLEEGTILTHEMIDALLERPIFSVYIAEEGDSPEEMEHDQKKEKLVAPALEEAVRQAAWGDGKVRAKKILVKTVPEKETLLDASYVKSYRHVFQTMETAFHQAARMGNIDIIDVWQLIADGHMAELCDGMRAITQIHNMVREGDYLLHHSIHVAILAGLMGRWMRMPRSRWQRLVLSGLLHDIGKLRIAKDILEKPGKLTLTELKVVQRHPQIGYEMLHNGPLGAETEVLSGVQQHHERNDGSGYPQGSHQAEIGDFGRILAILDIYDAMAANRSYAKKRSPFDVFNILSDDIMTGRLDTEYGILFIRQLCRAMNGNWVRLTNGEEGKIVYLDETRLTSLPVVQTMGGDFVDLNTNTNVKVECLLTHEEIEG